MSVNGFTDIVRDGLILYVDPTYKPLNTILTTIDGQLYWVDPTDSSTYTTSSDSSIIRVNIKSTYDNNYVFSSQTQDTILSADSASFITYNTNVSCYPYLDFSGQNNRIYTGDWPDINVNTTYSNSIWVYFLSTGITQSIVGNRGNAQGYSMQLNSSNELVWSQRGNSTGIQTVTITGITFSSNTWYHIVFNRTAVSATDTYNRLKFYIDKIEYGYQINTNNDANNNSSSLYLGHGGSIFTTGQTLDGYISTFVHKNGSLFSAEEINTLYNYNNPVCSSYITNGNGVRDVVNRPINIVNQNQVFQNFNGVSFNSGGTFNYWSYDFVNDYQNTFSYLDDVNFSKTDPFTISAWIQTTATTSSNKVIINKYTGTYGWLFYNYATGFRFLFRSTPGTGSFIQFVSTSPVSNLGWKNITVTYNGNQRLSGCTLYIDGKIDTKTTTTDTLYLATGDTTTANAYPLSIGKLSLSTSYFNGDISSIKIYNRELSSSEVLQNFKSEKWRYK